MLHRRYQAARRLVRSPLINLGLLEQISGAPIRSDMEFVDLFAFCSSDQARRIMPFFDISFYVANHVDAGVTPQDALYHFLQHGLHDWASPHPLIDLRFIAACHPDVFPANPRLELLLDCLQSNLADPSPFFSVPSYRAQLPESRHGESALVHYLREGAENGLRPNTFFDPTYYARKNQGVPASPLDAILHFVAQGDRERRSCGQGFDPVLYEEKYPDVAGTGVGPLEHYLRYGRFEGRELPEASESSASRGSRGKSRGPATAAWHYQIDEGQWRQRAERVKRRIEERAWDHIVSYREHDVVPVKDLDHNDAVGRMGFPKVKTPVIDILIPCYNEFEYTAECLESIHRAKPRATFRITILDDASPDQQLAALGCIPGIRYRRNPKNLHFLRSCNAGYKHCTGEFVLLLNNDTQLFPDTLDLLLDAINEDPKIGAVGPKILYPNGRLQESGSEIRADGTTKMIGVGGDPDEPCYSYSRDVAAISGACLLVRRSAIEGTLFDERYAPAYCEDVDLCLRLAAAGYRVRYVAEARLVHHLSVSTGKESGARRLQLVAKNQETLFQKWSGVLQKKADVRVLAYYLPQFHATPENDLWWGRGFTEWTNVSRALPSYGGHYQPHLPSDLGFYDLTRPEVLAQQQQLADRYGIDGFVVYYYNFKSGRVLHQPMENLLAHPEHDFRFCLCWANENWTKHWDGGEKEILLEQGYDDATLDRVCADAVRFARDPRAIMVDGKPLFLVYRPLLFPDVRLFTERLRAAFREAGWPQAHLLYVESMETASKGMDPRSIGFDACVEFPPQGIGVKHTKPLQVEKRDWDGHVYDYEGTVVAACARRTVAYPRHPAVFPSWDNTARQPLKGTSFTGVGGELFARYVEQKVSILRELFMGEQRMLFVNAWNEWAEGAHLEPDHAYGHTWLEALKNGVAAATWPGTLY